MPSLRLGPMIRLPLRRPALLRAHLKIHHYAYVGDLHTTAELEELHAACHTLADGSLGPMAPHRHPGPDERVELPLDVDPWVDPWPEVPC